MEFDQSKLVPSWIKNGSEAIRNSRLARQGLWSTEVFTLRRSRKIGSSLDNQTAVREEWISKSSIDQASKLFSRLHHTTSRDQACAREMIALYFKAGRLSFFIWSHPRSWSWVFPRGGSSSHWNPFRDEFENEELKGLKKNEIQAKDMRVLFCSTPFITRITCPAGGIHTQLFCLCGVVLSKDGITVDKHAT